MASLELKVLRNWIVFKNLENLLKAWAIVVSVGSQSEVGMRIV